MKKHTVSVHHAAAPYFRGGATAFAAALANLSNALLMRKLLSPAFQVSRWRTLNKSLVLLLVLLCSAHASAQTGRVEEETECRTDIDCSNLKLDIILDPANVGTDCSINDACGGGDNFRQLFYKVRLRYFSTDPGDEFNFHLDYRQLYIRLGLSVSGSGPVQFSHIDQGVTDLCYQNGPGANWGDTSGDNYNVASFKAERYQVSLDFMDDIINEDCGGDLITFYPDDCLSGSSIYCAYADLFTVAVNAYPGEDVQLVCDEVFLDKVGFEEPCSIPCNYFPDAPITVAAAAAPTAWPNAKLQLHLKDPEPTANGGCEIEIELENLESTDARVYLMEFVVKVSTDQAMQPFEVDSDYLESSTVDGNDTYLRFVYLDDEVAPGNDALSVGTITINPPVLQNQDWEVEVALIDADNSRLQAGPANSIGIECSSLPMDTDAQNCGQAGDHPCGSGFPVLFKVWPPENASSLCPSTKKVKVGLVPESPSVTTVDLRHFSFELTFDLDHGAAITGADTDPLQDPDKDLCDATETSGCTGLFGSSESDCWKQIGDDVFQYCFDRTNGAKTIDVSGGGAYIEVLFNAPGCIKGVTVTNLALRLGSPYALCIPEVEALPDPFSICEPQIVGQLATEADEGLEDATVTLKPVLASCDPSPCNQVIKTTSGKPDAGVFGFCPCEPCTTFTVIPVKDNDPLNGVSTFDLVLINKHILGTDPLGSPYKIIAADANSSGFVTLADLIDFRKLILGIFSDLPNNTSWRFIDEEHVFSDPDDPFNGGFPETKTLDMSISSNQEANFVAVKVGDVNGNAVTSSLGQLPITQVALPVAPPNASAGKVLTLPVIYSGAESMEAIQLGLRFDPSVLTLIGPSQGDLPQYGPGNFGLTRAELGEIRTLWFADPSIPDLAIEPGTVLFYLSFAVRDALPESAPLLQMDDAVLGNASWKTTGQEFACRQDAPVEHRVTSSDALSGLRAECRPNPTSGEAALTVWAPEAGRGRLALFGPFGNVVLLREVSLTPGEQSFPLPEAAQLPAGVYVWRVLTPNGSTWGHLVKQ